MKIKYKLILIFIFIIIAAALPVALFTLYQQEQDRLAAIRHQGVVNSRIVSRFAMNILLMNGGDIPNSVVDLKDMIPILGPLASDGLLFADVILLSTRPRDNGLVLARFIGAAVGTPDLPNRLDERALRELLGAGRSTELAISGVPGICIQFTATGSLPGKPPVCIGRLVFSREAVLAPIKTMRRLVYVTTGAAVVFVSILGFLFSMLITRPIKALITGVEKIGGGDLDYRVPVKESDELGILATTLNHLAQVVQLEIRELMNANIELKRLDRLKDEFLATISHELRSPLAGMIGIAESLIDGAAGPQNGDSVHDLSLVVASGRRLTNLVNDILDFAKLKHRDIILKNAPVNVHTLAEVLVSIMRPLAAKKGISLRNEIDADGIWVMADAGRLEQILMNLMGNAVKFTDAGSVIITAAPAADGTVRICVDDTGIGIPPDRIERIFDSFEQGDGSIERVYGGTGLGLTISRHLVELHQGSIGVESVPGSGSRFHVSLPAAEPDDTAAGPTPALAEPPSAMVADVRRIDRRAAPRRESRRILVVDDEPVILQVLMSHLSLAGHEVLTAVSGVEALGIIERETLHLVVLDVMLPRMSGYDVCRAIRERYSIHELPVLMLTAKNKADDVVVGLDAGANDYLMKPVNRGELLARVESLLSLQQSAALHEELSLIKRDIQIAHDIQKSILAQEPPAGGRVTLAVRYEPMTELGGDFYDVQMVSDSALAILIADVSGHGIPAAFICAMLKVAYSFHIGHADDPALILSEINASMFNFSGGQFITACHAYVDLERGELRQANAGHWPLLVWRRSTGELLKRSENYMPLGWDLNEEYRAVAMAVRPGDRIILYTDGIIEARDADDRMYGEERFHDVIARYSDFSADECADGIITAVTWWSVDKAGKGPDDDITLIVVDIPEGQAAS